MTLFDRISGRSRNGSCGCETTFEEDRLVVTADDCPGRGSIGERPDCRERVVEALTERDAQEVVVRSRGVKRVYAGDGAALLVAAGRFSDVAAFHDRSLSRRARRDPIRAAQDATARAGPVAELAARTGLAAAADRCGTSRPASDVDYGALLGETSVPELARMWVDPTPPEGAKLTSVYELETGAVARTYERGERRYYSLSPVETDLSREALSTLATAHDRLANAADDDVHPDRAPERAVRAVASDSDPVEVLSRILAKHTRGYGVLTDFFADPRVSDVYATAPVEETPLRVVLDDVDLPTNVTLTEGGAETLASRLRRESGRAFSRASPTLDATAALPSGRVRVAGVTEPVSDGVAFAFRDQGRTAWTLPALVDNGTLPAEAAALLSVAVRRDAATLVAGSRGAGKTTTLGAMLWELPETTRTLVIEDTPELPVDRLQADGRDVQALRTTTDGEDSPGIDPATALRTGLRLGESAIVVGEVRGEEATVLYEAMRVGASDDAVLGTIHGENAGSVRERVTEDLGVPASSFAVTDLVVTVALVESPDGRDRRLRSIEEVIPTDDGVRFASLYELDDGRPVSTGRVERGDSHALASLARPGEGYGDVVSAIERRTASIRQLVDRNALAPDAVRDRAEP